MMIKKASTSLAEHMNIALSTYSKDAPFTLEEWLHSKEVYRNNKGACHRAGSFNPTKIPAGASL